MSQTTGGLAFVIDGREYPAPDMDSLTMLERRVMYDLCGIVQEDFSPNDGETEEEHDARLTKLMRHPGFMESLMTIGFQRGNPDMSRDKVRKVIESTNYVEAMEEWMAAQEDADQAPLALTPPPEKPSSSGEPGNNESGGASSTSDSVVPDVIRGSTGITPSDTSPTWGRVTLHT